MTHGQTAANAKLPQPSTRPCRDSVFLGSCDSRLARYTARPQGRDGFSIFRSRYAPRARWPPRLCVRAPRPPSFPSRERLPSSPQAAFVLRTRFGGSEPGRQGTCVCRDAAVAFIALAAAARRPALVMENVNSPPVLPNPRSLIGQHQQGRPPGNGRPWPPPRLNRLPVIQTRTARDGRTPGNGEETDRLRLKPSPYRVLAAGGRPGNQLGSAA